ncbi:MAG: hypothetical protein IJ131_05885 [Eggerthellaceae bacterium]|nr:hypothetical protein [Eggerthellaceae bacterium]
MNIFDSYIYAGQQLTPRDKEQYYTALVEFIAYDFEPKLKGAALAVFTAIRPSLELSKQRANSGRKGGTSRSKAEAEGAVATKQNANKTEASGEANGQAMSKSMSKSKEESPNGDSKKARPRFVKPTEEQVSDYAAELGNPTFDAAHFIDYYESNGWKVGRNPMKDWKATVRNWVRKDAPQMKGGEYHAEYD